MNADTCLRIQSWIDGELPAAEAAEVERLVQIDAEAGALARSLRSLKACLAAGEVGRTVSAGREHYWGGIATALEREVTDTAASKPKHRPWWFGLLAPLGAAAVAVFAFLLAIPEGAAPRAPQAYAEIINPRDDVGSFTFRSESEQMTVVWVDTR